MRLEFDDGLGVRHVLQPEPDPFREMWREQYAAVMGRGASIFKMRYIVDSECRQLLETIAGRGPNILRKPEPDEPIRCEYRGVPIATVDDAGNIVSEM
jgi:hypothetical protein